MERHLVLAKRMDKGREEEERSIQLLKSKLANIYESVTDDVVKQLLELKYDAKTISTASKNNVELFDTVRMEFHVPILDKDRKKKQVKGNKNHNRKRIAK